MTPPINIDGSQVSGVTIDGTDVSAVTVDGTTVFSAIPDSGLLHNFDAISGFGPGDEGDTTTAWPDEEGSAKLSGGSPTVVGGGINSMRSVDFVQNDEDKLSVSGLSIGTPVDFYIVLDLTDAGTQQIPLSEPKDDDHYLWWKGSEWNIGHPDGANSNSSASSSATQLFTMRFGSSSAILRENGTEMVNVSSSGASTQGIQLGAYYADSDWFGGLIGQVALYDPTASGYSVGGVESYFANKWGVSLA